MKLMIEVHLGNEAMQDVVEAKNAIETALLEHFRAGRRRLEVGDIGNVRDLNGNTVGRWEVVGS